MGTLTLSPERQSARMATVGVKGLNKQWAVNVAGVAQTPNADP